MISIYRISGGKKKKLLLSMSGSVEPNILRKKKSWTEFCNNSWFQYIEMYSKSCGFYHKSVQSIQNQHFIEISLELGVLLYWNK